MLFGRTTTTIEESQQVFRAAEARLHEKSRQIWRDEGVEAAVAELDDVAGVHAVSYNKGAKGRPVVCLHGFATASAIYATSLPVFAAKTSLPVYALDTPGCGLSRRDSEWSRLSREDAERLVADALDEWREAKGYDDIYLVAHSIGAVLAAAYAERYPSRVAALALASPAGVDGAKNRKEDQDQDQDDGKEKQGQGSPSLLSRRGLLAYAWRRGLIDPFSVVRTFPETGRRAITSYVDRRFSDERPWTRDTKEELRDYLYENIVSGGDVSLGGVLLSLLLEPLTPSVGVRPLEDRLCKPDFLRPGARLAFLYGQRDWMPDDPARRVQRHRTNLGLHTPIAVVDDGASHNLMVDNPIGFADALARVLFGKEDELLHDAPLLGGQEQAATA
mmetsp:Transcript_11585/g.38088  ORF Transcript_11585/g.38088 Transcript_11585/m.38088 type:complete len:389 (-) Transcript_11585:205-1371(-)